MRARVGKRWIVLGAAGLGLIAGALTLVVAPSGYTATGTVFVSITSTKVAQAGRQASIAAQVARSYAALATTPVVLEPVVTSLRLDETADQLAGRTSADIQADTTLVKVSVTDPDPQRAVRIDAAIVQQMVRFALPVQPAASVPVRLSVVEAPSASSTASTRNAPLALLGGSGTGAGLGALFVLLPELLRRRPSSGGLSAPSML